MELIINSKEYKANLQKLYFSKKEAFSEIRKKYLQVLQQVNWKKFGYIGLNRNWQYKDTFMSCILS